MQLRLAYTRKNPQHWPTCSRYFHTGILKQSSLQYIYKASLIFLAQQKGILVRIQVLSNTILRFVKAECSAPADFAISRCLVCLVFLYSCRHKSFRFSYVYRATTERHGTSYTAGVTKEMLSFKWPFKIPYFICRLYRSGMPFFFNILPMTQIVPLHIWQKRALFVSSLVWIIIGCTSYRDRISLYADWQLYIFVYIYTSMYI